MSHDRHVDPAALEALFGFTEEGIWVVGLSFLPSLNFCQVPTYLKL
jgi:hypothetical protein